MANQHFFKPLLPGFHSHLTIPVAFFFKNIEGRNEDKTAELRSDASKVTWKVKIDGQRLADGWKESALVHDLRIGDIIILRRETSMTLTTSSLPRIQRKKKKEVESSLDLSCFVANVTPSNLRYDSLNLPLSFVRENGVDKRYGDMILMNEKGRSWTVALKRIKEVMCNYLHQTRVEKFLSC